MRYTELHVGNLIKDELKRQRRSVAWLAMKIHTDTSNAYKILKRKSIDTEMLLKISVALECNFFQTIADAVE